MAKYIQRGESLDYKNATGAVITAGTPIKFGARVGVAGCDIAPNELGSIHVDGVFEFPTEATIAEGAEVFFDGTKILAATASGAVKAGYAVAASAAGIVAVKINA